MRWLIKLTIKFTVLAIMLVLIGFGLKYARPYIMKAAGMPVVEGAPGIEDANFSSEESDLMSTVLKSALELFTGKKSRNELANNLSDKLYDGRMDTPGMKELGIELDKKPEPGSSAPKVGTGATNAKPGGTAGGTLSAQQQRTPAGGKRAQPISGSSNAALDQLKQKAKPYLIGLALVPVVLLVLVILMVRRRRRARMEAILAPSLTIQGPTDTDVLEMKHAVHSLKAEEFELLVALIYQRQGYRISLPAGLGGERGMNFAIARKSERMLVQCKRLSIEHKVPVERVRELHEAMTAAGVKQGIFVASCGFSWDARNFGKAKGVRLVNASTLDALLTAVRKPDEDLLDVSQWAPQLLSKVELTSPTCPACEAKMDQLSVSDSGVWVCGQRPDCRGRRSGRKHRKPSPAPAQNKEPSAAEASA